MTDNKARAALAARWEDIAFVPLLKLADIRFRKHRNCAEVAEDQARGSILRKLGRD